MRRAFMLYASGRGVEVHKLNGRDAISSCLFEARYQDRDDTQL